ncbi:DUF2806 domain-containing protein [Massilia timonae]|uniref:DUF2806 domain-containing protein n=1 Tax=Massilia timonae TaxID=47229 RepID=UPI0023531C33|nr:DUF2806 domain-containing protein [Massilia timonae]
MEEKEYKLSLAVPGERLLEKMWDSLSINGIATLLKPWSISREGKAHAEVRRYEVLSLAQAKADAADIRAGKKRFDNDGKLVSLPRVECSSTISPPTHDRRLEPTLEIGNIMLAATTARASDLIRSEVNIAETVLLAEQILAENPNPAPSESIEDDWLAIWRDHVSKVSSERLQYLWASALAGEVAAPGSYSIRTLDFLRTLSKVEAEEIAEVAQYQLQGAIVKDVEPILSDDGLSFGDLLKMRELGILAGVGGTGLATKYSSVEDDRYIRVLRSHDKLLIVQRDEMVDLKLTVFKFTTLGQQIMELGNFKANIKYLRNVGRRLVAQGYRVVMADLVSISPTEVEYKNEEEIFV